MTDVAKLLLDGIDENAVDLRDNYSGKRRSHRSFPAAFPNLLANGSQGIAVGMATSIPPHNVAELCDAGLHLIAHRPRERELLEFVQGPDFPHGRRLSSTSSPAIAETYAHRAQLFPPACPVGRSRDTGRGTWVSRRDRNPWLVQKIPPRRAPGRGGQREEEPLVADVRDEVAGRRQGGDRTSLEDGRRPRPHGKPFQAHRTRRPRIPLNLNVLVDGVVPQGGRACRSFEAMASTTAERCWFGARNSACARSSTRIEVLGGCIWSRISTSTR